MSMNSMYLSRKAGRPDTGQNVQSWPRSKNFPEQMQIGSLIPLDGGVEESSFASTVDGLFFLRIMDSTFLLKDDFSS